MHEESLVRSLINQIRRIEQQHEALGTVEVVVEIGPLSGVEPLLFEAAFERVVGDFAADSRPRLCLLQVPLKVCCQECGVESDLPDLRFACPACQSGRITVIQGDAIRLLNVQLRLPVPGEMAGLKS